MNATMMFDCVRCIPFCVLLEANADFKSSNGGEKGRHPVTSLAKLTNNTLFL